MPRTDYSQARFFASLRFAQNDNLSKYIRDEVLAQAEYVYEE